LDKVEYRNVAKYALVSARSLEYKVKERDKLLVKDFEYKCLILINVLYWSCIILLYVILVSQFLQISHEIQIMWWVKL
jgi:hypothetical protein